MNGLIFLPGFALLLVWGGWKCMQLRHRRMDKRFADGFDFDRLTVTR